ncbi:MAG: hypothetical protein NVSMB21_01660 [Vulcanimicrobiaceae bacterium]
MTVGSTVVGLAFAMPVVFLLAMPIVFVLALGLAQLTLRFVYDYRYTDARFEVRLFGRLAVYAIPWREVIRVAPWRFSLRACGTIFTTLGLGNRFGRAIVLERRGLFPRYVIITPPDAEFALRELRARIARADPTG